MSTKNQKKDRELRREIEILKAQLKTEGSASSSKKTTEKSALGHKSSTASSAHKADPETKGSKMPNKGNSLLASELIVSEDAYVKADLTKTLVLSIIAFTIIIALWMLSINDISIRDKIVGLF